MNEKMLEMTMISLDDGVVMPELSFYLDATTREACEAVGHAVKNEECIFLANPVHKNEPFDGASDSIHQQLGSGMLFPIN